jgi:hypothetical protein
VSADFPGHPPDGLPDDAFGGIPGDLLGDIVSSEPGLDALLGMLTADPAPGELGDEKAALAMFRANLRPPIPPGFGEPDLGTFGESDLGTVELGAASVGAAGTPEFGPRTFGPPASEPGAQGSPHISGPRAPGRRATTRPGRRVGLMAAAITLAAAAAFAVAAYTEALPAPVQQAAYRALGFVGVPAAHHSATSAASSRAPGSGRRHGASPRPGHSRQATAPASPQRSASSPAPGAGQASLTIIVASGRVTVGQGDTFTGRLTDKAGAVGGANLTLLERAAGQPNWYLAGIATTGRNGGAAVTVSSLTMNAAFRLKGPDGALSRPVLVIVVPPVSASVASSSPQADTVTAASPFAAPGDTVVLQILAGTHWLSLKESQLNSSGQAGFLVRLLARPRVYRVVLLPTASHGISVSNAVLVPPR